MGDRHVIDRDGNIGFRLQRYVWRSKPTASPLTGRPVRCVVGQDENGQFRPATRIGLGKEPNPAIETKFAIEPFSSKAEATQASRELTRDFLAGEAEVYSQQVKDTKPGQQIVKVEMDDGWSMAINAAGRITPEERRVMQLLSGDVTQKKHGEKTAVKRRDRNYPSP
jgi:hypothetical protein